MPRPGLISILLTALMASPMLASISSPEYLPFALEKRECGFLWWGHCHCQQVQCFVDFCFDDKVDPWVMVDRAMSPHYGNDCGHLEHWRRNDPGEGCDAAAGLHQGTGVFYIHRRPHSDSLAFAVNYRNDNGGDPSRGSVFAICQPVKDVHCTCHGKHNPDRNDCSAKC